jgi:YD repeat-containing protein
VRNAGYDSLYHLTEEKITDATAGNRTLGYSYDLAGNRLTNLRSLGWGINYAHFENLADGFQSSLE